MSDHTPGPWSTNCRTNDIYQQDNGLTVVELITYGSDAKKRFSANKLLIAAAPEMLEALKRAVELDMIPRSSASDGGASKYSSHVKCADQIRSAIAKATGQEESE